MCFMGRPAQGGEGKAEYRMRCEILIDVLNWTFWWLDLGSSFDCRSAYNLRVGLELWGLLSSCLVAGGKSLTE